MLIQSSFLNFRFNVFSLLTIIKIVKMIYLPDKTFRADTSFLFYLKFTLAKFAISYFISSPRITWASVAKTKKRNYFSENFFHYLPNIFYYILILHLFYNKINKILFFYKIKGSKFFLYCLF